MATSNVTSDLATCSVESINVSTTLDGRGAAIFSNTAAIVRGHDRAPRFGHPNNITLAMTGSQEDADSYLMGLISASILMFAFFTVWLLVVLVLKFMGYKRVGFLSGSNVRIPTRPPQATSPTDLAEDTDLKELETDTNDDDKVEDASTSDVVVDVTSDVVAEAENSADGDKSNEIVESADQVQDENMVAWEKQVKKAERRLQWIRISVIFFGLVIVVMAILMVVYGVKGLNTSIGNGQEGLAQGESLAYDGVGIIDSYMKDQNETLAAAQDVVITSNGTLCPEAKDIVCSYPGFDCSVLQGYPSFLLDVTKLYLKLISVQNDLTEAAILMNDANEYIERFTWAFYVAVAIVMLYAVTVLLILNGVIMAWKKKLRATWWQRTSSRIRGWVVVPLFVILLVLGWIFSMVFVIGTAASSDFCYESPDNNTVVLLDQNRDSFSNESLMFPALVYYVSGCPENSTATMPLPEEMLNVTALASYLDMLYQATEIISAESEQIAATCGSDPEAVESSLAVLQSQICVIATTLNETIAYFSCENFNSLYAKVAYDALCYNGTTALSAITITQFVILFSAMIMLTLRVAFYEVVDESELVEPHDRCMACCRRCKRRKDMNEPVESAAGGEEVEAPKVLQEEATIS